jgi:hypothetical protein
VSCRARSLALRPFVTGLALLLAAAALTLARPTPAAAEVTHLYGFRATVDGFTSWYGSYGMGQLGIAWCIDHGIHSPDPVYQYVPADLSALQPELQAAMAWAVTTNGQGTDRVTHAALMLALHDLMGARYPSGRLDVDRLSIGRLAGFGGAEGSVLAAARAIKADGIAHAWLRGPLQLTIEVGAPDGDGTAPVIVRVVDDAGQGLSGVRISFDGSSAALSATSATTGPDGSVRLTTRTDDAPAIVHAAATVPHLPLDAWSPTTARAQRVARPTVDRLDASGEVTPPTTTTTTSTTLAPTTTIAPSTTTTSTTLPPPTTTAPSTTVPTTIAAATSVPVTTMPVTTSMPVTTAAPQPEVSVLAAPPMGPSTRAALPRTGLDALTLSLFGAGLLLVGRSLLELRDAQPSAPRSRSDAMRSSS